MVWLVRRCFLHEAGDVEMSWRKGIVEWTEGSVAYISVVFSWDAQAAFEKAVWYRQLGFEVRVGGPGVFVLGKLLKGIARVGGDIPDVVVRHNPLATFASRGCPVGCSFCIVPAMEGRDFTLLEDFTPRPILCDNNLSALPQEFQRHIVKRYKSASVPLLDANSGFEPATFNEDVLAIWRPINMGPWRFAYDESAERDEVLQVALMLRDVPPRRKRVYVLIGNEPFKPCMDRILETISWGCEPHVQPIMKLNARTKKPWVRFDWTEQKLRDTARWANRWIWRHVPFHEYDGALRRHKEDGQRRLF